MVLAPGPCETPPQRKPSEHPTTQAPQSTGQWGADTGQPLPTPRRALSLVTRLPRQHLLSVAGSKEPSWPLGHPRDSQSGACAPLREGYARGWQGSPEAVLSGRTFTYRDALMLCSFGMHCMDVFLPFFLCLTPNLLTATRWPQLPRPGPLPSMWKLPNHIYFPNVICLM